jgi:putative protease
MVAAVSNGADAVYLGGTSFNARQGAANFADDDLARALEYCHVRGVRVYVTVNTLIKQAELPEVARFLGFIHSEGADAVIVQDLAVARIVRDTFPRLDLHASTQMTIHNSDGLAALERLGFTRAILARELSLGQIAEAARTTSLDLEVFAHGALCVSYSGQCLMSSMIGGRSGNRGKCAQPCRLEYTLVNAEGKPLPHRMPGAYLLSPRDLAALPLLAELTAAGVRGIKLEGRMKRPEYVATVTRVYRAALDRLRENPEAYGPAPGEMEDLEAIFNRGFTTGYLQKNQGADMMSPTRPNNRGVLVGRVQAYDRSRKAARIRLELPLSVGDGIEVWVTTGGRSAGTVGKIFLDGRQVDEALGGETVWVPLDGPARPGDRVMKTSDAALIARARDTFAHGAGRRVPLTMAVQASVGEPLRLTVTDPDGNVTDATGSVPGVPAERTPLSLDYLRKQLGRLGTTPFVLESISADLKGDVIVPVSDINDIRRAAVDALAKMRVDKYRRAPVAEEQVQSSLETALHASRRILDNPVFSWTADSKQGARRPMALAARVTDLAGVLAASRAGADIVCVGGETYAPSKRMSFADLTEAVSACRDNGSELWFATARIVADHEIPAARDDIRRSMEAGARGVLVGNLGLLAFAAAEACGRVAADWSLNCMNSLMAADLAELGDGMVVLSCELTMEEMREVARGIGPQRTGAIAHGALELMVSEQCVVGSVLGGRTSERACSAPCTRGRYALLDRVGAVFPVLCDASCRMHIRNSVDLCMVEHVHEFAEMGLGSIWLDLRCEDSARVARVVQAYREARSATPERLGALRHELEAISGGSITKGHYFRGV